MGEHAPRRPAHLSLGRSPSGGISPDNTKSTLASAQAKLGLHTARPPSESAPGTARGQVPIHPTRVRNALAKGPVAEAKLVDSGPGSLQAPERVWRKESVSFLRAEPPESTPGVQPTL